MELPCLSPVFAVHDTGMRCALIIKISVLHGESQLDVIHVVQRRAFGKSEDRLVEAISRRRSDLELKKKVVLPFQKDWNLFFLYVHRISCSVSGQCKKRQGYDEYRLSNDLNTYGIFSKIIKILSMAKGINIPDSALSVHI